AFVQMGSYDDALGYFDKALKIAATNPDTGYQFLVNEGKLQAFRSMGKLDDAEQLASEIIAQARAKQKHVKETQALISAGTEASETYDRASDILDTMIGNVTSAAGKIGLISSMSAVYVEHFALAADHLKDTAKAFSVLEHARGRVTTELLMSGKPPDSPQEVEIQKQISRLNLELAKAKSAEQVREIRDKIFLTEQARWLTPLSGTWES